MLKAFYRLVSSRLKLKFLALVLASLRSSLEHSWLVSGKFDVTVRIKNYTELFSLFLLFVMTENIVKA